MENGRRPPDVEQERYKSCDHDGMHIVVHNTPIYWCPGYVTRERAQSWIDEIQRKMDASDGEWVDMGGCDKYFVIHGGHLMPKQWLPMMAVQMLSQWAGAHGVEALTEAVNKEMPYLNTKERRPAIAGFLHKLGFGENQLPEGDGDALLGGQGDEEQD